MPLYEYHCDDCGHDFEDLQPMKAPKTGAECPSCSGTDTRRLLSTFSKGSGSQSEVSFPCGAEGAPPCGCKEPTCLTQ